jgi:hypothetical protein
MVGNEMKGFPFTRFAEQTLVKEKGRFPIGNSPFLFGLSEEIV